MIFNIIEYLKNSFEINPIGQIIGFIAFILGIIAFLHKNDTKTKAIHGVSLILRVIHYYIFGLYTGLICDLIGGFRNFFSIKYKSNKKIKISLFIIYIIAGFITFDNIYSILPTISGIIATIAFFYFDGIKMRLLLLLTPILWIFYDYLGHSLGGIITDIFYTLAHITTITRLLLDKKSNKFGES